MTSKLVLLWRLNRLVKVFLRIKQSAWLFPGFWFYEKTGTLAFFTVKLNRLVKVFLRIKQSVWLFPCCWGFYSFFRVLVHFLKYLKIRENPDSRIFYGKTFLLMSYWTILTLYCLEAVTWGWPAKKALLKITQNLKKSISVRVSYLINLQATGVIV